MENNIQKYEQFNNLINEHFKYDEDTEELIFVEKECSISDLENYLIQGVTPNKRRGNYYISKDELNFKFFVDRSEFQNKVRFEDINFDIYIKNFNNSIFVYISKDKSTFKDFTKTNSFLISNTQTYFESKDLFTSNYRNSNLEFEFVDFYSEVSNKIVFSSITERNKVTFKIPLAGSLKLNEAIDYRPNFISFKESLNSVNKTMPIFIKRSLIDHLYNITQNCYETFFEKLDVILKEAKLNFNVYLHELSLDDIINDYSEYKIKFFKEQTEIQSKISTQVIALPLSIAGVLFAIYKLKETITPIIIIIIGLLLFLTYASYIFSIFISDLNRIKIQTDKDFAKLHRHKFFQEHDDEFKDLEKTKRWLNKRTDSLRFGLIGYSFIIYLLNTAAIFYSVYLLNPFEINLLFWIYVILSLSIIIILQLYIFKDRTQ